MSNILQDIFVLSLLTSHIVYLRVRLDVKYLVRNVSVKLIKCSCLFLFIAIQSPFLGMGSTSFT